MRVGGTLRGENVWFDGVATDSRTIRPGELFVALKGERFDGHDYIELAQCSAARSPRWSPPIAPASLTGNLLAVADPLRALGALAAFWRRRFTLPVVGIVGSNGKTTVKEMTAAILRASLGERQVLATPGNLNNAIGLPLTVLGLRAPHRAAVIEIGMNHPGETAELAAIALPTIGLINNAQREHQEFMKSVADVAAEHAALISALPERGIAVINADDDYASFWQEVVVRRNAEGAALALRDFGLRAAGGGDRALSHRDLGFRRRSHDARGQCDAGAAGAGTAQRRQCARRDRSRDRGGGEHSPMPPTALEAFRPLSGRLRTLELPGGGAVIDDTYNANPDSVRAAIAVLARAPAPRWLVLGDMGEVGDQGVAFHREVGAYARAAGVDRLLAVGDLAQHAVAAFGAGGEHFIHGRRARRGTARRARASTVLVKGSRFMRMERVVSALTNTAAEAH